LNESIAASAEADEEYMNEKPSGSQKAKVVSPVKYGDGRWNVFLKFQYCIWTFLCLMI